MKKVNMDKEINLTDTDVLLIEGHESVVANAQRQLAERATKTRSLVEKAHGLPDGSLGQTYQLDLPNRKLVLIEKEKTVVSEEEVAK